MLFDLNIKNNLAQNFDKQDSTTNTELSTTSSTSSIVNADESPVSGTGVYDFFVDYPFVTRQLFPTTIIDDNIGSSGDGGGQRELEVLRLGGSSQSSNYNQWLNLSVSGSSLGVVDDNNNKQQVRRSRRGPRSRSSQYRGVTFYRRTGRWESHIWDCGKQVYLGGFDTAHAAARAYDRAAIKFRGVDADINFNLTDYDEDMKLTKNLSKVDFVQVLRRQSNGFSRGNSRYRGVTLNKCGRWEARMGQFLGNKAYDQAPIQCKGREAVTNFVPGTYEGDGHNLDLNLGIPITMGGPKSSNNMGIGESQTHESPIQLPYGKRPVNGPSTYYSTGALPLCGQPMASRQFSTMWSELPQGQLGTYEERVNDQKLIVSARQSNWAWHMQSQGKGGGEGGTSSQVQLSTNAASSGFPFSNPSPSSTTLFTHPQINRNINSFHQGGQGRS